jgi:glycerol-3-phosphate dehydrogenase
MNSFSAHSRLKILSESQDLEFDLVIIGGGITGAGIALDAASRGLTILLLEQVDFAFGTSSRSTKLIHGGLRYLKQLEFNLVREVGKERAILYQNARHLVRPEPMLLPVIIGGSLGKTTTALALWVYEWLAGVKVSERRIMLDKQQCLKKEPLLDSKIVQAGAIYTEYRTDDARLTISVCKTAIKYGARIVNHAEVTELLKVNGIFSGVKVLDRLSGQEFTIKAKCIVNSAGPWVDQIRKQDGSLQGKSLHLTKGVHLVFPFNCLPVKQAVYFDTEDGRMIFAIPRGDITYLGTTDTNYNGEIDFPKVSKEDVQYLLKAANRIFPSIKLEVSHIESAWAGLRPLIHEEGKNPSELSRKDELFISNSELISIAGGKLTGFRVMAKRVTDKVVELLAEKTKKNYQACYTQDIQLSGGDFETEDELTEFHHQLFGEGKQVGISFKRISQWIDRYGKDANTVLDFAYTLWPDVENKQLIPDLAEMYYSIQEEMSAHPADYFIRRTGQLYFQHTLLEHSFDELYPWFVKFAELSNDRSAKYREEIWTEIKAINQLKNLS